MNEEILKKINKKIKIYINESNFISIKCRNKIIKLLGEKFSINLPIENYKTIDIYITKNGSIIMRDEEYKSSLKLNIEQIKERYENFKLEADKILKKKEINYYKINDKNNFKNIIFLLLFIIIFLFLLTFAIKSFFSKDYFNCVWLFIFILSYLLPGIKERIVQAKNFLLRKFKK